MKNFAKHARYLYDLPFAQGIKILRPEQVILRFGSAGSIDIGALCYLNRGGNRRKNPYDSREVDSSTFDSLRSKRVLELIEFISECYQNSGRRASTLFGMFRSFVSVFMDWADKNAYTNLFDSEDNLRGCFRAFVDYLRERVIQNKISVNTAARCQAQVLWVLENYLDIDDLAKGINLLARSNKAAEQTIPPCENTQGKMIALCEALFFGLSDLVIEHRMFPFQLKIPDYLQLDANSIWVFPTTRFCVHPHLYDDFIKGYMYDLPAAYNYLSGRVNFVHEIKNRFKSIHSARLAVRKAKEKIFLANQDSRDNARLNLAQMAFKAFIVMFIASTGMNNAQLVELVWGDDEFELGIERQGFRTIKWRAGYKKCEFEMSPTFLSKFKLFLRLRRYLLNGTECDYLFFTLGSKPNTSSVPRQLKRNFFADFAETLRKFDPSLKITSREWRAAKSDWLIRNTDPATAARIMQNTERTLLKHYAAGAPTEHLNEMSKYFVRVSNVVVNKGHEFENSVERATGGCCDYGVPQEVVQDAPIRPDCRTPEGCLFCNKFRVHADERDTRKLLSCNYCLLLSSPLAESHEQFKRLFSPILDRIQLILGEIKARVPGLVEQIKVEVEEEGELDPYWAGKIEMLNALELVAVQ